MATNRGDTDTNKNTKQQSENGSRSKCNCQCAVDNNSTCCYICCIQAQWQLETDAWEVDAVQQLQLHLTPSG
ncbi:hypothetical protein ACP70R_022537 [Stipagrostis hirtigluma subsp. patula]